MDIQKINAAFKDLANQTNKWIQQGFTPTIERHLALQKLQEIYQSLLDDEINTTESANKSREQHPSSPPMVSPISSTEYRPETVTIFNQEISKNQIEIFTRELFWRDSSLFENEIKTMESLKSFDSAIIYISEKYNWSPANQYANQFVEILEKYY